MLLRDLSINFIVSGFVTSGTVRVQWFGYGGAGRDRAVVGRLLVRFGISDGWFGVGDASVAGS